MLKPGKLPKLNVLVQDQDHDGTETLYVSFESYLSPESSCWLCCLNVALLGPLLPLPSPGICSLRGGWFRDRNSGRFRTLFRSLARHRAWTPGMTENRRQPGGGGQPGVTSCRTAGLWQIRSDSDPTLRDSAINRSAGLLLLPSAVQRNRSWKNTELKHTQQGGRTLVLYFTTDTTVSEYSKSCIQNPTEVKVHVQVLSAKCR